MSDNRVRIWFSLFVLAVFCVGLAGGVVIGRRLTARRAFAIACGRAAGRWTSALVVLVGRADRGRWPASVAAVGHRRGCSWIASCGDLDLTADQRTKVEEVLTARRAGTRDAAARSPRTVRRRATQPARRDPQGADAGAAAEVRQERTASAPLRTPRAAALGRRCLWQPAGDRARAARSCTLSSKIVRHDAS